MAVIDGEHTIFFIGLPLHLLNNPLGNSRGLTAFFEKALQEFNPSQVVNRRKF
jgi:hypothetical protein